MIRLVRASRAIREAVPPGAAEVFGVVTVLGSGAFLVAVLAFAYWTLDRREGVLALLSVAFVAMALTILLKAGLDLPRPPPAVRRHPVEAGSAGFPSGHVVAATVVYGGALVAFDRLRDVRAVTAVGVLVGAVSLSRVVLGVHYLGDVLAGISLGVLILLAWVTVDPDPAVAFGGAAVVSVLGFVVAAGDFDAAVAVGGSLGALVATARTNDTPAGGPLSDRAVVGVTGAVGLATVGVAGTAVRGVLPAVVGLSFVVGFGIVALPWAVEYGRDVVGVVPDR